uniref:CSON005123 protein n=1 Tax=Culicoides sonorensis TaxID=179676 RepID=A0A336L9F4_CULSO
MLGRSLITFIAILCCSLKTCLAYQDNSPQYWNYINEVAQARIQHENAVYEQSKYQKLDETPPKMNTAAEEEEDWVSKLETTYAKSHQTYGQLKNSQPVEDTASEKEKSQTRDHSPLNILVVNGYEGFSNTLNKLIDTPWNFVAKGWDKWLKFWDFIGSQWFQLNHPLQKS